MPADFDQRLHASLEQVRPLRSVYRRGIGWRLSTSGTERFYNTRTRQLEQTIPADWDLVRRWLEAGATWAFVPEVTLDYYVGER